MRLNVKYKQALTKTDKQKKANAEKKKKGPKLSENYNDNSNYNGDNALLDMTRMRYGIINCCDVDYIELQEGTISLTKSWLEVLLLMLANVIENNKTDDKFNRLFEDNNVTSMFFCVDKVYGKYCFEQEEYKAYKIYDTGYYLEMIPTSGIVFDAIAGLIKCMEIPFDQIKFHVRNKMITDSKLNFELLEETEDIVNIDGVNDMLKSGIHMVSVNIMDNITSVHRLDVALIAICSVWFDEYGVFRLTTLPSNNSTGIKILEDDDILNDNIFVLKDSEIGVYCDGDTDGIIQFIKESIMLLDLDINSVKFKFKSLKAKDKLKEWELD